MNKLIISLLFFILINAACKKNNAPNSVTSCTWTYKNQTNIAKTCFFSTDTASKFVIYAAGDSTSDESVNFRVPVLSIHSFNFATPYDSAGLFLRHFENGIVNGISANSGNINIISLSSNFLSANVATTVNGDSCIGTFINVPIN